MHGQGEGSRSRYDLQVVLVLDKFLSNAPSEGPGIRVYKTNDSTLGIQLFLGYTPHGQNLDTDGCSDH